MIISISGFLIRMDLYSTMSSFLPSHLSDSVGLLQLHLPLGVRTLFFLLVALEPEGQSFYILSLVSLVRQWDDCFT